MNYKEYTIVLLRSLADMKLSDKQAAQWLKNVATTYIDAKEQIYDWLSHKFPEETWMRDFKNVYYGDLNDSPEMKQRRYEQFAEMETKMAKIISKIVSKQKREFFKEF